MTEQEAAELTEGLARHTELVHAAADVVDHHLALDGIVMVTRPTFDRLVAALAGDQ